MYAQRSDFDVSAPLFNFFFFRKEQILSFNKVKVRFKFNK